MVIDSVLGPWRPDRPALNNVGVTVARNVLPAIGATNGAIAYEPMKRVKLYSDSVLPSRPLGAISGQDTAGNGKVYAGCSEGLFKVSPSDLSWQDASRTSSPYTGGSEKWNFTRYGSWAVGTNFVNFPQFIDMNEDLNFDDLTTLVKARYVTNSRGFVIVANTNDPFDGDVPYRVRWSGLDQPQSWDFSLTTQADFQDINGGSGVIQGIVGGEDVTIFMKNSIVKMTYVGTPLIWQFDEIIKGKGCAVPESLIETEDGVVFLSDDGFYFYDGSPSLKRIGEGKVDNYFLRSVNTAQYSYMSVAADPAKKLIYWCFSSQDAIDGTPDKMLIFNYSLGEFTEAESEVDFIYNSVSLPWTIEQLDQFGTIEDLPAPFDSSIWAGGNSQLAGMSISGKQWLFTGDNQTGLIESNEQFLIQLLQQMNPNIKGDRTVVTRVRPIVDGNGTVTARVGSRLLSHGDVVMSPMAAPNESGWCNIRQQGRFHRVRLILTGNFTQAQSFQYDAVPAGLR
jgi:hypothetical protein